jgi:hypothetical protein
LQLATAGIPLAGKNLDPEPANSSLVSRFCSIPWLLKRRSTRGHLSNGFSDFDFLHCVSPNRLSPDLKCQRNKALILTSVIPINSICKWHLEGAESWSIWLKIAQKIPSARAFLISHPI